MGSCFSKDETGEGGRSAAIDKILEDDARKLKKECKILLLGAGESGKSTIVKQMKIIHQNGYTRSETMEFVATIHKNTMESMHAIIQAIRKFEMTFQDPSLEEIATRLLKIHIDNDLSFRISPALADEIERFWADPTISSCLERSNQFYLLDSAPYFIANVKRVGDPAFIPSEQDILRARTKTTGITETRFYMGTLAIHMFDVGGQRSERRKWIHCFENVTSIIFCVALSEYDQVLLEDSSQNRMVESLVLFESVINSRWFLRTSIVLFLNKIDLFKEKLVRSPIENHFPDYNGGPDFTKASKYILWRFTQTNRAKLNIYPHLTQATDTSNIKLVFAAVKVTIMQNALKDSGMM